MNITNEISSAPLAVRPFISGSGLQKVFTKLLPAREGSLVVSRLTHAGNLLGIIFTIDDHNYYIEYKDGLKFSRPADADILAAGAMLIDEDYNELQKELESRKKIIAAARAELGMLPDDPDSITPTRTINEIKEKLISIPEAIRNKLIVIPEDVLPEGATNEARIRVIVASLSAGLQKRSKKPGLRPRLTSELH